MNALTVAGEFLTRPTAADPIPTLAAAPGLSLLRSATAPMLVKLQSQEASDQLRGVCQVVLATLQPASTIELGLVLEGLALHYPQFRRTPAEQRVFVRQWADDFEGWPLDLLEEGARLWRNSPAERFPTPGQLKGMVEPVFRARQGLGKRAASYLKEVRGA